MLVVLLLVGGLANRGFARGATSTGDSTAAEEKYWIFFESSADSSPTARPADRSGVPDVLQPLREHGIRPIVQSRWFDAVSAHLAPSQRAWVRSRPFVRSVRPVRVLRPAAGETDANRPERVRPHPPTSPTDTLAMGPSRGPLSRINAVAPLKRGLNGRGVRIGFLDAHFRGLRHPALAHLRADGRMIALRNFTDGLQSGNHGSAVASVAMGRDPGSILGPAWGAQMLGATTEYTPSERNVEEDYFVAGLEWLAQRGADVVNVSVGYNTFDEGQDSYTTDDLDGDTGITTRAVDRAAQRGMVVVVSAGNSGCASPDSCWYYVNTPADADSAIAVGAIQPDSTIASFSSRGPTADGRRKPDVVVQGARIVAAWTDGGYARVGGTSFAAPQVAGIVAQMLQVHPDLTPIEVRRLLRQTASQSDAPDDQMGWGIVNAERAVRAAERRARANPPSALQVESPVLESDGSSLTVPVRVPAGVDRLDLTLTSPLGQTEARIRAPVRPGPNWLSLSLPPTAAGLYFYRVRGARTVETGTVSIPQ